MTALKVVNRSTQEKWTRSIGDHGATGEVLSNDQGFSNLDDHREPCRSLISTPVSASTRLNVQLQNCWAPPSTGADQTRKPVEKIANFLTLFGQNRGASKRTAQECKVGWCHACDEGARSTWAKRHPGSESSAMSSAIWGHGVVAAQVHGHGQKHSGWAQ
jgi:hypothetical protein